MSPFDRRKFLKRSALALPGLTALSEVSQRDFAPFEPSGRVFTRPFKDREVNRDFWDDVRDSYALSDARTYMNTGGLGQVSKQVLEAFHQRTVDLQTRSETGHALIETAREPVASFFGASPKEICFTRNATEGNAIVASGLRLDPGDEVIIDASAHPGGAIPWLNQLNLNGLVIRTFEPDASSPEELVARIAALITPKTKVISVSHITAPTGILLPVEAISALAKSHGCWFHVDGAQSAGMIPINLHDIGCDSYATSGHKWLGALHGTGILYIAENGLDRIQPTEIGAYSDAGYSLPRSLTYIDTARRHESGTRNAPLVESVQKACSFLSDIGIGRIQQRGIDLAQRLRNHLQSNTNIEILSPKHDALKTSILTFRSPLMDFSTLNQKLSNDQQFRLRVVTEQELNAIRVSLHIFNTEEGVDRLGEAINAIIPS